MMEKGVARLCRLSGLGLMRIDSNYSLQQELEEQFQRSFVEGQTLEHEENYDLEKRR